MLVVYSLAIPIFKINAYESNIININKARFIIAFLSTHFISTTI